MKKYCDIVINNNSRSTDNIYTYSVPEKFSEKANPGVRVVVDFNNRIITGMIVGIRNEIDFDEGIVKPVLSIIDGEPIINEAGIKLGFWIREYYVSRYIDAFRLMFPPSSGIKKYIRFNEKAADNAGAIYGLYAKYGSNRIKMDKVVNAPENKSAAKDLIQMAQEGILEIEFNDKLSEILGSVSDSGEKNTKEKKEKNTLYPEQKKITQKIFSSDKKVSLIHGITGSGKTEIYFDLIEKTLNEGKRAIYLLPEISLTSQMIERFRERFSVGICILHSRMSPKKRNENWACILKGEKDIVIGPRSALFAPVKELGIIIVDEEHEDSYKSSVMPKYDTVKTAIMKGQYENCRVVLGTATPSVESYYEALNGSINLFELNIRAKGAELPEINVVDMREELNSGNRSIFSNELVKSIKDTVEKNHQVILFLNKRGYTSFVSCRKCGYVIKCEKCDVSMTYHRKKHFMICHYCGSAKKISASCPECGSKYFRTFGSGTQKVEEAVKNLFPEYSIGRMDIDTAGKIEDIEKIYDDFKKKKTDILVGTQMLAKSFDFENVTLVGIISADITFNLPFYSSNEKAFQLAVQVSGRCGRGKYPGKVILQTYDPENYSVAYASKYDFKNFFNNELSMRKKFVYPPYIDIINIAIASTSEGMLKQYASGKYLEMKNEIEECGFSPKILLYKPAENGIFRINNQYRMNTTMKINKKYSPEIKNIIREVYLNKSYSNIKVSIDINPNQIV